MSDERLEEERHSEALATVVANAVMRRFTLNLGDGNVLSDVVSVLVFDAAREVMRTVFGPEDQDFNVLKALDEIEELETALKERA